MEAIIAQEATIPPTGHASSPEATMEAIWRRYGGRDCAGGDDAAHTILNRLQDDAAHPTCCTWGNVCALVQEGCARF